MGGFVLLRLDWFAKYPVGYSRVTKDERQSECGGKQQVSQRAVGRSGLPDRQIMLWRQARSDKVGIERDSEQKGERGDRRG